ncbi:MAG: extracellular solute-binding protein [Anaerolineales bacterium]|nr:extracellular solute-binding protein [Anaerolineales bacterium]
MHVNKFISQLFMLLIIITIVLTACGSRYKGELNVIGFQKDWCNYGEILSAFSDKYDIKINELNADAGSGDKIEAIKATMDNKEPQAPDVVDVSFSFGEPNKDLFMPYKVSTWNTIPNTLKNADGYWYGDYYGIMAFLVNTEVQSNVPQDWADLLDSKYAGQVALSGNPRVYDQAIQAVQAAALANGGSLDNAQAGLDFFAQLNQVGNFVPVASNNELVAKGETPIRITWDYNALNAMDAFAGNPKAEMVIPKTGQLAGMNVQAISAYAPHPESAKLWMEFLYSDEGQLLRMKGYCHPIREIDLRARGMVPVDLAAKLPDTSGAVFPSLEQLNSARELITEGWDAAVGVDIKPAP